MVTVLTAQDGHAIYVDGGLIAQGPRPIADPAALRRLIAELGGRAEWRALPASAPIPARFPARLADLAEQPRPS